MTTRAGMSTRAVVVALLAGLAALALPGAAPSGATTPSPTTPPPTAVEPPAHARLAACRRSPSIDERVAVVGATMRPIAGGEHLALRIHLQQRMLGLSGRWTTRTDVPGLGEWITPSDALVGTRTGDVFRYRQAVGRLVVPYAYRFRVAFRWKDDAGAVVRETTVTTRACRQPDLRPDLVLFSVRAEPSPHDPGLVRYSVVVRNDGRSDAAPVVVAATLPGDTTPIARTRTVGRLKPGQSAVVRFTGPGCAAGEVPASFVVDPANAVEEADEANDELVGSCPAP